MSVYTHQSTEENFLDITDHIKYYFKDGSNEICDECESEYNSHQLKFCCSCSRTLCFECFLSDFETICYDCNRKQE